MGGYLQDS
jgi:hypothetical protein